MLSRSVVADDYMERRRRRCAHFNADIETLHLSSPLEREGMGKEGARGDGWSGMMRLRRIFLSCQLTDGFYLSECYDG